MPREILYSAHSCLFYLSGQLLLLPFRRFRSTSTQPPRYCNGEGEHLSMSVIGGVWDGFFGGQATLRGSLWIMFIILVCQQENQPLLAMFWKRKAASPGFSMFWVGLPHSSEVPPNKSPKSQCHTQHSFLARYHLATLWLPVRLIQRCSKHFTWPWVKPGWYLGGTWNILKLTQTWNDFRSWKLTMTWAMTGPSHPVSMCNEDWRACFPWASWLSACGSLGWRIWRFWSWKFMGSWQLVAINKNVKENKL